MSATPTPRAVPLLAEMVARYQGREIRSPLTEADANWWTELEREYLAALAASAGPLSAQKLIHLRAVEDAHEDDFSQAVHNALHEYRTAYTALAAECAQVTKERDALAADVLDFRGHEREIERYRYCDDCGRRMVWTSAQGESWVCPYHIWRRMKDAESDLAALRATVAEYHKTVGNFVAVCDDIDRELGSKKRPSDAHGGYYLER